MKSGRIFFSAISTAAILVLAGCCRTTPTVMEPLPVDPAAKWKWEVPTPIPPRMAWVPAGPFRQGNRTPATVDAIVIHTTEGGYRAENTHEENQMRNFLGNINYFKSNDRNVSAHFVMGPNGEICYMVNESDVAHTQTYYNGRGIGIECAGWSRRPETWTPEMLDSLVELVAYLCVKWEVPAYQPEGTAYEGPWSVRLDENTQRFVAPGIVGHYQVQPWNKSDPGQHFPWDEFTERVRERIRSFGIEPIPLPDPATEIAKVAYVAGSIKEEQVRVGEPFTYRLVVHGEGADRVNVSDITFPDLSVVPHITATSEPIRVESAENHAVFELPLVATEARNAGFTATRVRMNRQWHDSGTLTVRVAAAD